MAVQSLAWEGRPRTDIRRVAFAGYAAMALLAGCFGYWAVSAPLAGAVITQGTISAAGGNILIQHPEGGIIRELLVHEGDRVQQAQDLILLDRTAAQAELNRLTRQSIALEASASRLEAERDGLDRLAPITETAPAPFQHDFEILVREQQKEFNARLARFRSEQSILTQRVAMHRQSVVGLQAQKLAIQQQAEIVKKELGIKTGLLDKGLVLAGVEPPKKSLVKDRTVAGATVATGATVLGTVTNHMDAVAPAVPLIQTIAEYAPVVLLVLTIAGIGWMVWARWDDRRKGLR